MGLLYLFINTLSHNLGTLTSWNPLGHSRPVMGLMYLYKLSHNLGTLTSWNPLGHSRPVKGLLYLFINTLSLNLGTLTSWNRLGHSRPVTGLLYLYMEEILGDITIFVVKGVFWIVMVSSTLEVT